MSGLLIRNIQKILVTSICFILLMTGATCQSTKDREVAGTNDKISLRTREAGKIRESGIDKSGFKYADSPFGIMAPYVGRDSSRLLRELDVHWVRIAQVSFFGRRFIEKNGWGEADRIVQQALYDGQNLIIPAVSLLDRGGMREGTGGAPLRQRKRTSAYDKKAHEAFLADFIRRYAGRVNYFQVGNEFNVFWKMGPEELVDFLRLHYRTIKGICPECKVIFGALSSTPQDYYPDKVGAGRLCIRDFLEFLSRSRQSPDEQFFDILDFHWFGRKNEYKSISIGRDNNRETRLSDFVGDLKRDLERLNIKADLFICETGTHSNEIDDSRIPYGRQTEREQARELVKRYVYPLALGIKRVFWVTLTEWYGYKRRENGYFDNVGLVNNKHNMIDKRDWKKLSFYTYKLMIRKLEGSDWDDVETVQDGQDNVYIFRFKKRDNNKIIYVMWWDNPLKKVDDIKDGRLIVNCESVRITSAIPDAEDGSKINDMPVFKKTTVDADSGFVLIPLTMDPVYVEIEDGNK